MKHCAVITAAGCSSRMGFFKPVLPLGGRPAIIHLLDTLFTAGISHAVVVTGFQKNTLERLLSDKTALITLVHNPRYAETEMLESVRIGLAAVPPDFDSVLIIPADIPLVRTDTVRKVIAAGGEIVFPSWQMHRGHPLKLRRNLIPAILSYDGDDGLRGALRSLSSNPVYICTDDPFIIKDMDTPQDYQALLKEFQQEEPNDDDPSMHVELP